MYLNRNQKTAECNYCQKRIYINNAYPDHDKRHGTMFYCSIECLYNRRESIMNANNAKQVYSYKKYEQRVHHSYKTNPNPYKANPSPYRADQNPSRENPSPYRTNQNSYRTNQNPYRENPSSYKADQNPYRVADQHPYRADPNKNSSPYRANQNSYRADQNPYRAADQHPYRADPNSYRENSSPYRANQNSYRADQKSYRENLYGANRNPYKVEPNSYRKNPYRADQNSYRENSYRAGQNPYKADQNSYRENPYRANPIPYRADQKSYIDNPYRENPSPYRADQNLYRTNPNPYKLLDPNPYKRNPSNPHKMSPILVEDIIYEIIKHLEYIKHSGLFNWLFVNKHWSETVISYLWKNPFYSLKRNNSINNYKIIQTYITCFNEEERNELNSFEIITYNYQTPSFEYGKYLKEFKILELRRSIDLWFKFIKENRSRKSRKRKYHIPAEFETLLIHSLMRQCQRLNRMNWDMFIELHSLEIMQGNIKHLKDLTISYEGYYNYHYYHNNNIIVAKRHLDNFKNYCQDLTCLKSEHHIKTSKEFNSLIASQHNLKNFNFDQKYDDIDKTIILTLKLHANSLTKVILCRVDFSKTSFDYFEECINLELLELTYSKGLELEKMNLDTTFKNLSILDLSLNEWPFNVNILIIKKAGDNLTSMTMGGTIDDDTLIALTNYCPNINSFSISNISDESFNMLFTYIKNLKLNILQLSNVIKLKDLLDYIKYQDTLSTLGIGKCDSYWTNYDDNRHILDDVSKEHRVRIIKYHHSSYRILSPVTPYDPYEKKFV